jgi:hypothetical protein
MEIKIKESTQNVGRHIKGAILGVQKIQWPVGDINMPITYMYVILLGRRKIAENSITIHCRL